MKFKTHYVEKLHGNYFIYNSFETNENFHYKNLKALFPCQKKRVEPPPKTEFLNWKVHPLLMWMGFIFPLVWMLGVTFTMDEMTSCFKIHRAEK